MIPSTQIYSLVVLCEQLLLAMDHLAPPHVLLLFVSSSVKSNPLTPAWDGQIFITISEIITCTEGQKLRIHTIFRYSQRKYDGAEQRQTLPWFPSLLEACNQPMMTTLRTDIQFQHEKTHRSQGCLSLQQTEC